MSEIKQAAFLQGYLDKEAFTTMPTGSSLIPKSKGPSAYDKATSWLGDKMYSGGQAIDKGKKLISNLGEAAKFGVDPEGYMNKNAPAIQKSIEPHVKRFMAPYAKAMEDKVKQGMLIMGGANALGQVGTAMYQNAAANRRHQQMMQMMKKMYGQRQAATPPQAFRLSGGRSNR